MAEGLNHLHGLKFVHRDVAARNVLITSEARGKVSDFGMSRDQSDGHYVASKGGAVAVRWTAPEAIKEQRFSAATDSWAYGKAVGDVLRACVGCCDLSCCFFFFFFF